MYSNLKSYIESRIAEFDQIPDHRKADLGQISEYVSREIAADRQPSVTFICTHNSRRSHMAQIWAQTAAAWFDVPNVATFSGGTEATAFNYRAVDAFKRTGMWVDAETMVDNTVYSVSFGPETPPMQCFSKVYTDEVNPQKDYAAVMTCSAADQACPVVAGSARRIAITYEDPKDADDTPEEEARYDERCAQIAREMLYAMSLVSR